MADMTQVPINGNYAAQHGFPESFHPAHAAMNTAANFQPAQSSTPTSATPSTEQQQKNEITKDEVGWFFVEQYYTTMSRNPDKLHLFYSKRSQLVFGTEAESVPVAVGTKAINDKIKALDFQDCKVRVLNVDSQASFDNILVAVIGEISNKSEPSRKFVQTFVLAEQPNGYYVLNDVFRYLVEENEEDEAMTEEPTVSIPDETQATETVPAPEEAQVTDEAAVSKVDEKLEEVNGEVEQPEEAPKTNGAPVEDVNEAPIPVVEPEALKEEKPQTPEPSPAPEKAVPAEKEAAAAPAAPVAAPAAPIPAVPKTWANIASKVGAAKAAAAAAAPAVPAATSAAPASTPATAAPKAAAAAAPSTDSAATTPRAAVTPTPAAEKDTASADGAGWQTAGADHKKSQSRAGEDQVVMGYMKNVNEKVDAGLLKQTLARFGKLKYFDVNRPKNSAFVEFAEPSGYTAAVAANPHQIGTEQIILEERRPRPNNFGNGFPAGRGRGGRGDRGGSQGRFGFQRDGRGGFPPRGGRGGNAAAKGRNGAPAA